MRWHGWCSEECERLGKCEFWPLSPLDYTKYLMEEVPDDRYWKQDGSFFVSINGLVAITIGHSQKGKLGRKLHSQLVDILIPDLCRRPIAIKTSDLKRLRGGLKKENIQIQNMFTLKRTRIDIHRLVCYWYKVGSAWGCELESLSSGVEVHHHDRCRLNNRVGNLFPLDRVSHNFVTHKPGKRPKIKLNTMLEYLAAQDRRMARILIRLESRD